jgi:hypothetical protein
MAYHRRWVAATRQQYNALQKRWRDEHRKELRAYRREYQRRRRALMKAGKWKKPAVTLRWPRTRAPKS